MSEVFWQNITCHLLHLLSSCEWHGFIDLMITFFSCLSAGNCNANDFRGGKNTFDSEVDGIVGKVPKASPEPHTNEKIIFNLEERSFTQLEPHLEHNNSPPRGDVPQTNHFLDHRETIPDDIYPAVPRTQIQAIGGSRMVCSD